MSNTRLFFITLLAMIAFAGNSLLCRFALTGGLIDAVSFTTIRLFSGAAVLSAIIVYQNKSHTVGGNWLSAFALFAYATGFSYAYISISAATGALVLFAAVQVTMISFGIWSGERLSGRQILGILFAVCGLVILLLPGVQAPPLFGAILMLVAGVAWGIYSLRGREIREPIYETAGNFVRAVPMAATLYFLFYSSADLAIHGIVYAFLSGAFASGLGYAIWYMALPYLNSTTAATVQLSVPALTAIGGVLLLAESITLRLTISSVSILGGISMCILSKRHA